MQLLGGFVQADKSAKSYLEYSSFSRQGPIDQLKYEVSLSRKLSTGFPKTATRLLNNE